MAATPTTVDSVLKEFYLPQVRNQLNNTNWYLMQIERNGLSVEGRRAVLALKTKRGSGIGARANGGTLPNATNAGYAEERVPVYRNYGRIEIDGQLIKKMKSDKGSFVRAVQSEMEDVTDGLKRDFNRQLWGTSNGIIATCTVSTTAQATVLLATATTTTQMNQFEEGMLVDIGTIAEVVAGSGGGGAAYGLAIGSIDESAKSFTFASPSVLATATAATDFVFRAGNGGDSTNQKEVTGLQTIVDSTGTLHNVDPTVNGVWKSTELSNSGTNRALTDELIGQLIHTVQRKSGKLPTSSNVLVASDGVFRYYAAGLTPQKRFATTELKGGFKGLSIEVGGGSPVGMVWERDCPGNSLFYLDTSHLKLHEESDWDWMDLDGAILTRAGIGTSGKDAYEATLFKYAEQATDQRNAHGKILDLLEA